MNEFTPKLVLDSRIHDITHKVDVAVESSGSQSTYQNFPSVNSSNSSITFNVNVPSENIAVDRRILLQTDFTFTVEITNVPATKNAFCWGETDGFGQFPLNACFSQVQATINSASVNVPLDDVMAPLLRLCDQSQVSEMNLTTASYLDKTFSTLTGMEDYSSNPLSGGNKLNYNDKIQSRGVLTPSTISVLHYVDADGEPDTSLTSSGVSDTWTIAITTTLTEPLLFLSPFTGLVPTNDNACFLGINNMNIVCNIGSLGNIYKTTNSYTYSVSLGKATTGADGFSNPKLLMNFLTLQPEQWSRINTRNVLPIQSYPRFVSTWSGTYTTDSSDTFTFPVIQLNQIPDTLLIFVRPPKSDNNPKKQTGFLSIESASISFNNQSGILASCSPQELYNISKMNGSQQTWSEFSGYMNVGQTINDPNTLTATNVSVSTQGSLLVVKPAYNFNLPSFLSSGSLGQYGLQVSLKAYNRLGYIVSNPEMVVIAVNSGIMVTQQGSTSLYSGLLTKEMVLSAKQQKPVIDSSTYNKLVGGGVQESCKTALRNVVKKHFGTSKGAGASGGGASGGGMSGGSLLGHQIGQYSGAVNKMSKYI